VSFFQSFAETGGGLGVGVGLGVELAKASRLDAILRVAQASSKLHSVMNTHSPGQREAACHRL